MASRSRGTAGVQLCRRCHDPVHVLRGYLKGRVSNVGRTSDEHLVHHDTEGVDVRTTIHRGTFGLLRREVRRRAHHQAVLGQVVFARHRLGDTEVGHLHLGVGGDQDVARLDVAVNHAIAMRVVQCGCDLSGELGST